jgi:hypothetical protein
MLQLHGGNGTVACAGQQGERDEGAVSPLDVRPGRHPRNGVPDLFHRREGFLAAGGCDPRVLVRQVEVLGVRVAQLRLVAGLAGEPEEEPLQVRQGCVQRRLAEFLPRRLAVLLGEAALERDRLLEVKGSEVAKLRVFLEPRQRLRDGVHGGLAVALGLLQVGEVLTFDPLVIRVVLWHGFLAPF